MDTLKRRETALVALSILALVLFAAFSQRFFLRADLSSSGAFTLSDESRRMADALDSPMRIDYYLSANIANQYPEAGEIEDFLRELEAASAGKLFVRVVDPIEGGREKEAEALGVTPVSLQKIDTGEMNVATAYCGVVINYKELTETIPMAIASSQAVTPGFEYDLVKLAARMTSGRTPIVGMLSGERHSGDAMGFANLAAVFQYSHYEVVEIQRSTPIPEAVDALVVSGSGDLDEYDLSFVEAYLRAGGSALFAVQPFEIRVDPDLAPVATASTAVFEMLAAWGVRIGNGIQMDAPRLRFPSGETGDTMIPYPHWILADDSRMAREHPLMKGRDTFLLPWAAPMFVEAKEGVATTILASTSESGWTMVDSFATSPDDENMFYAESARDKGSKPLIVALEGPLPSYFASRAFPAREGAAPPPVPAAKALPSRVVVVPCTASFRDYLYEIYEMNSIAVTPAEDPNYDFARAAADWLSRDDSLALRARLPKTKMLDRIGDKATRDFLILLVYAVTLVALPLAVVAFGLLRAARRKAAAKIRRGKGA